MAAYTEITDPGLIDAGSVSEIKNIVNVPDPLPPTSTPAPRPGVPIPATAAPFLAPTTTPPTDQIRTGVATNVNVK